MEIVWKLKSFNIFSTIISTRIQVYSDNIVNFKHKHIPQLLFEHLEDWPADSKKQ